MSSGGIIRGANRRSFISKSTTLDNFIIYFEELPSAQIFKKYRRQLRK